MSEFLREKHCDGEIDQQEDRENQSDCRNPIRVHGLPQPLASLDVEKRHGEENCGEQQHECVLHCNSLKPNGSHRNSARQERLNRNRFFRSIGFSFEKKV
jgi:hypothetical protein